MLITISALTCFPQSVSTDIFWRPSSFNTFAATEMPWQSLLGNICWARKMCEAGAARDCFIGVTGMAQLLPWKRVCVSGSGLQEDQLSGLPYLPNRPICHTELPVQNLARCLHKRRRADEGLSRSWAAPSPHMFAQLAKWQERGLVLSYRETVGLRGFLCDRRRCWHSGPGSFQWNTWSKRLLCSWRGASFKMCCVSWTMGSPAVTFKSTPSSAPGTICL